MSVRACKIQVIGTAEDGKETEVFSQDEWDGDFGEWMEIGGEAAAVLNDFVKVGVVFTPIK